jgi:hypothetical protein
VSQAPIATEQQVRVQQHCDGRHSMHAERDTRRARVSQHHSHIPKRNQARNEQHQTQGASLARSQEHKDEEPRDNVAHPFGGEVCASIAGRRSRQAETCRRDLS